MPGAGDWRGFHCEEQRFLRERGVSSRWERERETKKRKATQTRLLKARFGEPAPESPRPGPRLVRPAVRSLNTPRSSAPAGCRRFWEQRETAAMRLKHRRSLPTSSTQGIATHQLLLCRRRLPRRHQLLLMCLWGRRQRHCLRRSSSLLLEARRPPFSLEKRKRGKGK